MQTIETRMRRVAIVIGADEVGSAIAIALHRASLATVLCDDVDPPWARRGMAYTNAWYAGSAELDGEAAVFCSSVKSIPVVLNGEGLIAATTWPWAGIADALQPSAIVDARQHRHEQGMGLKSRAPEGACTIGIGANFKSGIDVDVAIEVGGGETNDATFAVAQSMSRLAGPGQPRGVSHERCVFASGPGRFTTGRRIGDRVREGEVVAAIGARPVTAPLDGVLRGLSARGARIFEGAMVVEIDPRGDATLCYGIEERSLQIAQAVISRLMPGAGKPDAAAQSRTFETTSGRS
jgi:xanthine dehydrogenase accessory factor